MSERLVIIADAGAEAAEALDAYAAGTAHPRLVTGNTALRDAPVAFVFSGNGSQWAGMALQAYRANGDFRARLDSFSDSFARLVGWSLCEALQAPDLAIRLRASTVAQPLLFAIQAALHDTLTSAGLVPAVVLGHSVGEVAAAYAAGALGREQALRVIAARSTHQELARGAGKMAALVAGAHEVAGLVADSGCHDLELAAINSPNGVTLAGPQAQIERFALHAERINRLCTVLDLDYPFHSRGVEPARAPLLRDLADLAPHGCTRELVSTVTGTAIAGVQLDAEYWWRNIRASVRFAEAIAAAAQVGARVFL